MKRLTGGENIARVSVIAEGISIDEAEELLAKASSHTHDEQCRYTDSMMEVLSHKADMTYHSLLSAAIEEVLRELGDDAGI